MLADNTDKQKEILQEALELCRKVKTESDDVLLSKEAVHLEAACRLMLQEPNAVLDLLGEEARPIQSDIQLIGCAYQLLGNVSKAQEFTQIGMYQHLMLLQDYTPTYLMLYAADAERTNEIMRRAAAVADAFNLNKLHPNVMLQIYLAAAGAYCMQGNQEKALDMLRKYTDICVSDFFPYRLHGDDFFDKIEGWFEGFSLGSDAPRSEKLIKESMVQGLSNPLFAALAENPQYKTMLEKLKLHSGNN
jgi:hypothetical protein